MIHPRPVRPAHRQRSEGPVVDLVVKILINAAALFVAVQLLPDNLLSFKFGDDWWKLLAVALVFALVNSYIKPIVKALSMPIGLLTMGLIAFVINAAMLFIVALASDALKLGFKLGTFPPTINSDAIVGALLAAVIISVVSTLASVALSPRKLI
jgi:putative membrane protein